MRLLLLLLVISCTSCGSESPLYENRCAEYARTEMAICDHTFNYHEYCFNAYNRAILNCTEEN